MAATEGLDELLAGLASMGFEFEECHQAIQAGNTNLQSAVEWLMEKKSQSSSSPSSSIPTIKTQGDTDTLIKNVSSTSSDGHINSGDQDPLTSRCNVSEDARKSKERFIEKEREQAKMEAKKRKLEEKKVRQQILMQIADDRESRKEKSGTKAGLRKESLSGTKPCTSSQNANKQKQPDHKESFLKLRLPNGQVRTGSVSVTITLIEAIVTLSSHPSLRQQQVDIIQPFPHKTFTSEELDMSLDSLGLHPSAMIVVQKKQASISADFSNRQSSSPTQNVQECSVNAQQEPEQPLPDDNIHQEEPEIPVNVMQPPPMLLNPGNVGGRHQAHHWPVGEGMRLGAVEYNPHAVNPVLPSSSPAESAARRMEMRERRLQFMDREETAVSMPQLHREVRRLEDICIDNVSLRISGHPKLHPLATLGTLSHDICDKILDRLMKNKGLTPRSCLRYLRLDCYLLVTNELLSALRLHKNLTLVSLKSCPLITDKAIESLSVLKKLQSLNINQCSQLTDKCFVYLKELPSLTILQMDGTKVTDEGVSYFVNHAESASKLTHLSLCNTTITDLSLQVIKNLKSLTALELEKTKITSLDALSEMTNLERLNVSFTQLADHSVVAIRGLPSLKSLNLLSTNITDHGLQQLHSLHLMSLNLPNRLTITDHGLYHIKGFPLTALDISDYINVTDLGIHHISTIYSLTKLTLSNTRLSDVGFRNLSGLVNLVELNADRTAVTDEGCQVIQNFQNLQILSLSSTLITNASLLTGVINKCVKLTQLNLSRTRISNKGIRCLILPSLTLLNMDWTRVTTDCQILLTGCPCLKALRTNNCTPPTNGDDSDDEEG